MGERVCHDREIVGLYFARDEAAIGQTDRKYRRYLLTIAQNILRDERDCEEVLNDTYLAAWNSIPPASPESLAVFLSAITRRIALSLRRKRTSAKRVPSELTESLEELDECLFASDERDSEEIARVLNGFLETLAVTDRDIFVCRYYFSDSVADIARMQRMSRSSIFKKLAAMRAGLREALEKEELL